MELVTERPVRPGHSPDGILLLRELRRPSTDWACEEEASLIAEVGELGSSEIGRWTVVRKIVAGMARMPIVVVLGLALLALGVVFTFRPRPASATPVSYSSPFWTVTAAGGLQEKDCPNCGGAPSPFVPPGVSVLTGELVKDFHIASTPTLLGSFPISLRWRSGISGGTDFGLGIIPSFMTTVEETNGGANVTVRLPSGIAVEFTLSSGVYSTTDCCYRSTLTKNSGVFRITNPDGSLIDLDNNGMPDFFTDPHGNLTDATYNSSLQFVSLTTDRNQTITAARDAYGWISSLTMPGGATWTLSRDNAGNLVSVTTPTTPDQTSGIDTVLNFDGYQRLTSVTDGNANDPWTYHYVGTTPQIDYADDAATVDFSYTTNRTDVTDRNGIVTRYHYSGRNITKVEQWIGGASAYATDYTYSGGDLITIVKPLGNRIDFTRNGAGLVTQRRQKETNTANTSGSDIVDSWTYSNNRMSSHTDPRGNQTTYSRSGSVNVTAINFPTVTSPATQSSVTKTFTYNGEGQITETTDEDGNITSYEYFTNTSAIGLLKKVKVDPAGLNLVTEYAYNAEHQISTITDPLGKVTTFTFDDLGRKTEVVDPLGVSTKWHYDGNGNVTSMEIENLDKDGNAVSGNGWLTTSYTYSVHDDMLTMTEEIDASTTRTTTFEYDDNQNRIRVIKPEGNKEKWTYNSRRLIATHTMGETSAVASTDTLSYDNNGNLTMSEDGLGNDTIYTYDLFDRRVKTTDALGNYEETDYDKAGNVTEVRRYDAAPSPDVLLQRSTRYYDQRGRHWKTSDLHKDPSTTYSDAVTTIERWKSGRVRYVTDPRSKVTQTQYDAAWRVSKTIDAMLNEAANTYDANGRRTVWSILEKDGGSSITHSYEATYDDGGRMTQRREIDRTNGSNVYTTDYGYDSRGNLVWTVNAEGNPSRFTYDGVGRMTKKEVALTVGSPITTFSTSINTQWGFDKNNRLVSFKDDAANERTFAYDAKDRQTSTTHADSTSIAFVHDAANNVTQVTDPAGNVISDTFDAMNRNTARSVSLATGFIDTTAETRTYDALGRMLTNVDDDYKVTYTYGSRGLESTVYEEKQEYAVGTAYQKVVTTKHDAAGNRTYQNYPSGLTLTYGYNDINAVDSVTDGASSIASLSYIGYRHKVTTFGNWTTQTNTYGGFREDLTTIHHETSTPTTLLRIDYGYNKLHDHTYERFGASGSAGDAFEYDKAGRLTNAWMGSSTPASPTGNSYIKTIAYNMDDVGNRTSVVTTPYGVSATTTAYTTNSVNRYTSVGGTSQTLDANGNVTDNGTFKFKYSYRNLLCEVRLSSNNALVATYAHDAMGRRIRKDVSGGTIERFIYAGSEVISTYDGAGAWRQDFVHGSTGAPGLLMLRQADLLDDDGDSNTSELTNSYHHRNAFGAVVEVTGGTQGIVVSYRYDAFGSLEISRGGVVLASDPLGQNFGLDGRLYAVEIKAWIDELVYVPELGIFLSDLAKVPNGLWSCWCVTITTYWALDEGGCEAKEAEGDQWMRQGPPKIAIYKVVIRLCIGVRCFSLKVVSITKLTESRDAGPGFSTLGGGLLDGNGNLNTQSCIGCHAGMGTGALSKEVAWQIRVDQTPSDFGASMNAAGVEVVQFFAVEAGTAFATGGIVNGVKWGIRTVRAVNTAWKMRKAVKVIHYTDAASAAKIIESGALRAESYVALQAEARGLSAAAAEKCLELRAGQGAMSVMFKTPASNLLIPPNGPKTSGLYTQFVLKEAVPVAGRVFLKSP